MKPWRITIDTNPDLCNLNCIMCDTHSKFNPDFKYRRKNMPEELMSKAISEAATAGVQEIIPTTMGEPLLYPHFEKFVDQIIAHELKLNLTTNGTFPNGGIQKWGEKLIASCSDIKISINSMDPSVNESIMQGTKTQEVLSNIDTLIDIRNHRRADGLPASNLTLQLTFMKSNLDHIEKIIQYAVEHGIDRVKGHQLWVTWPQLQEESLRHDPELTQQWNELLERIAPLRDQIKLENFEPIETVTGNSPVSDSLKCPFLGKELWVDHDGTYNVCCCPSETRKQLGNFGNIQNISINDLFNSNQYIQLKTEYKNNVVCRSCPLRRIPC